MSLHFKQVLAIVSSLPSCIFCLLGAAIGLRPLSLFRFGADSIPGALQRQSVYNAFAALFAAVATASQAAELFWPRTH